MRRSSLGNRAIKYKVGSTCRAATSASAFTRADSAACSARRAVSAGVIGQVVAASLGASKKSGVAGDRMRLSLLFSAETAGDSQHYSSSVQIHLVAIDNLQSRFRLERSGTKPDRIEFSTYSLMDPRDLATSRYDSTVALPNQPESDSQVSERSL